VCTRNRASLLKDLLDTLTKQTLPASLFEVWVVDNASQDRTPGIVQEFASRSNFHYCRESRVGLSCARNRGWREAKGDYVAYIDDDCKVPHEWLSVAEDIVQQRGADVFGGPYHPFYNSRKPRWFRDDYAAHVLTSEPRELRPDEYLDGGNIFFRRSLLSRMGGFDETLGMSGRKIGYGEETDLVLRIRRDEPGRIVYFDPRLDVKHLVAPHRMKMGRAFRESFAAGRSDCRVRGVAVPGPRTRRRFLKKTVRYSGAFVWGILTGLLRRDPDRYPYARNYWYECARVHLYRLGILYEQFRSASWRDASPGWPEAGA